MPSARMPFWCRHSLKCRSYARLRTRTHANTPHEIYWAVQGAAEPWQDSHRRGRPVSAAGHSGGRGRHHAPLGLHQDTTAFVATPLRPPSGLAPRPLVPCTRGAGAPRQPLPRGPRSVTVRWIRAARRLGAPTPRGKPSHSCAPRPNVTTRTARMARRTERTRQRRTQRAKAPSPQPSNHADPPQPTPHLRRRASPALVLEPAANPAPPRTGLTQTTASQAPRLTCPGA